MTEWSKNCQKLFKNAKNVKEKPKTKAHAIDVIVVW